ncbi:doublesex- and mab-3-related transcription factor 1-like [Betta splendens]|uniref:Doublesex- and mab-3-related transcription factor 1-like n=1 Tax=Betta splendens TaxID=158456 RepID=A0A6P7NWM5_BETSP|nr:doublesex- and mab-3-related transcription factor 1-like [Betta splendens]
MSLSKGKVPEVSAEPSRRPKCTRCRHHGIVIPQKGHVKSCPFLGCACSKCLLVTERTRIATMQRNLRRAEGNKPTSRQKRACARTEPPRGPVGGARALPTFNGAKVAGAPQGSWTPLDLRSGPAAGEGLAAGPDGSPEERGNDAPINVPYFGELRPSAPVHFIPVPLRMSGHYAGSCASYPALMINMPCLPPVPGALYNHSLYRPLMLPHFQHGAMPPPPAPPPPADCKPVFFTLQPTVPEDSQEELMPEPPLGKQADLDIVGLD